MSSIGQGVSQGVGKLAQGILDITNTTLDTTKQIVQVPGEVFKTTGKALNTTGKVVTATGDSVIHVLKSVNSLVDKSTDGYSSILDGAMAVIDLLTMVLTDISTPIKSIFNVVFFPIVSLSEFINRIRDRRKLKHKNDMKIQEQVYLNLLDMKVLIDLKREETELTKKLTDKEKNDIELALNAAEELVGTTEGKLDEAEKKQEKQEEQKGGRKTKRRKTKRRKTKRRNRNKTKKRI
jgi:ABC-type multidrug transport system fused ATPase/permease subunit